MEHPFGRRSKAKPKQRQVKGNEKAEQKQCKANAKPSTAQDGPTSRGPGVARTVQMLEL